MLRPIAGIVFEPIAVGYSFRWGGEFGPQTRGPQAYAQSGAVPLPSGPAGVLAGAALAARRQPLCSAQGPYGDVERGLRLLLCPGGGGFALRGPYLYARWRNRWLLCAPMGRGRSLFCAVGPGGGTRVCSLDVDGIQRVGIALNNFAKTAVEGLIYTSVYVDPLEALRLASKTCLLGLDPAEAAAAGVLVEAYADEACGTDPDALRQALDGTIVQLGGETRPARIRVIDDLPGLALAEALAGKNHYLYIASPILLPRGQGLRPPGDGAAGSIAAKALEAIGLRPRLRLVAWGRLRLTALGLGYSLCRNRRRPYHAAVLPGAVLDAEADEGLMEAYMRGFGEYRELGWGTLLPVPGVPRQERKRCHA